MVKHETKIQKEADALFEIAKTQMAEVMLEQAEHGMAFRYFKDSRGYTWVYEDGFRKFFGEAATA